MALLRGGCADGAQLRGRRTSTSGRSFPGALSFTELLRRASAAALSIVFVPLTHRY